MTIPRQLALRFLKTRPSEAAGLIDASPDLVELLRSCEPRNVAELLSGTTAAVSAAVLEALDPGEAAAIAAGLAPGSLASVLRHFRPEGAEALLEALPAPAARQLRVLLQYDEGSAGALMDPTVLALSRDQSVAQAREHLREAPQQSTYYLYVVGPDQQLVGVLTLRDLLLADAGRRLSEVMRSPVEAVRADAGAEAILAHGGWRLYHALPVVDREGRLLGAIRYETERQLELTQSEKTRQPASALNLAEQLWIGLATALEPLVGAYPTSEGRRNA